MKILVTGAAGFIAFHLIESLLQQGHSVIGVDNFISGQKKNIEELKKNSNFSFYEIDILQLTSSEANKTSSNLNNIDEIYHLACPASPPIYQNNPLHTLDTCYLGSRNILEIAKKNNAKILLASTSEIYGDPLVHPQSESYRGNTNTFGPRACYDEGKRIMETLGYTYLQMGLDVKIARIFNTYGPRMSPQDGRILTNFITQSLENKSLTVYGDGKQTRSLCYVSDLVLGLLALMRSDVKVPVNLGSQFEFSVLEIAKMVRKLMNPALPIEFFYLPVDDPKQRRPDTSFAKKMLNWEAEIGLEKGLSEMVRFYLNK